MNIDEFKSGLKKLTVNKRVIIDDLTTLLRNTADAAEEIAAAIHEHIRRALHSTSYLHSTFG